MRKWIYLTCLLLASCSNQNQKVTSYKTLEPKSEQNVEKEVKVKAKAKINSSQQNNSLPSPNKNISKKINATDLKPAKNLFKNNTLSTPLFKMTLQEHKWEKAKEVISDKQKSTFLSQMYEWFLNEATFGNEVYAISEVIFINETNLKDNNSLGSYNKKTNAIEILMNYENDWQEIFNVFKIYYYDHFFYTRFQKIRFDYWKNQGKRIKEEVDPSSYDAYLKLFNDGKHQLKQNYFQINGVDSSTFPYLQAHSYEHEISLYHQNFFNLQNSLNNLAFKKSDLASKVINGQADDFYYQYYQRKVNQEKNFLLTSLNLYTSLIKADKNNIINLKKHHLDDYLMHLFTRTNLYYSYLDLKRKYPKNFEVKVNELGNYYVKIKKDDQLKWKDVNDFKVASKQEMAKKYQEWKDYFTNTLFNQDQLLANAFSDTNNNLYLELNQKDQKIKLEFVKGYNYLSSNFNELPNYSQLTFNLNPYSNQQKTKVNTFAYKISCLDLESGQYFLKINDKYLKDNQGLNLTNLKNQQMTLLGSNDFFYSLEKFYQFKIDEEQRIVLKVFKNKCGYR